MYKILKKQIKYIFKMFMSFAESIHDVHTYMRANTLAQQIKVNILKEYFKVRRSTSLFCLTSTYHPRMLVCLSRTMNLWVEDLGVF